MRTSRLVVVDADVEGRWVQKRRRSTSAAAWSRLDAVSAPRRSHRSESCRWRRQPRPSLRAAGRAPTTTQVFAARSDAASVRSLAVATSAAGALPAHWHRYHRSAAAADTTEVRISHRPENTNICNRPATPGSINGTGAMGKVADGNGSSDPLSGEHTASRRDCGNPLS